MNKTKKTLSLIGGVILSIGVAGSGQAADTGPIKIGGLFETSGFLAFLGKPGLEGARLATKLVNASGGINGRKVSFINVNTESNNTVAVTAVRRLIEQEKVHALVGAMNSGSSYSIIGYVQRRQIPIIANGASRGIVLPPEKKTWFFLAPLTDVLVQTVMVKQMKAKGIQRIAFLHVDTGFGNSGKKAITSLAKMHGLAIVAMESYGNKDKDMTPQLTRIRSTNAQATVIWGTGGGLAISIKNFRQLGIKHPVYISHAGNDFNVVRLAGPGSDGVLLPSSKLYVTETLAANDPQKPVIENFIAAFKKEYGKVPATFAGNGYDAVMMIANAMKKAGTNSKALRKAIEGTTNYNGVTAVYSYSPTNHFGAQEGSVVMLQVKGGGFIVAK
ncbi:MAG TPA: ABC transporter substrate-binding protein [Alphaproteobacteria bacterium]|nr:ABC transporter substrate-binding protein [Alphaproteobacteria bacterium]